MGGGSPLNASVNHLPNHPQNHLMICTPLNINSPFNVLFTTRFTSPEKPAGLPTDSRPSDPTSHRYELNDIRSSRAYKGEQAIHGVIHSIH